MTAVQEIPVIEFTRRLAEGLFTYVMYQGRCVKRKHGRGRPHYEVIAGIKLTDADRTHRRRVNVNSQVARLLLSHI